MSVKIRKKLVVTKIGNYIKNPWNLHIHSSENIPTKSNMNRSTSKLVTNMVPSFHNMKHFPQLKIRKECLPTGLLVMFISYRDNS